MASPPTHIRDVLTLDDLATWPEKGTWLAVLGHPIKHSISPAMHNAALKVMAQSDPRFLTWKYVRFDIDPVDLPQALECLHAKGFLGLNLTVPHKVLASAQVRQMTPEARAAGAVNTLRRTETGWEGFNTDGYGLAQGLSRDLGASLAGANILLLGAGGAARAAAVQCLMEKCASLSIGNRSPENLNSLLKALIPLAGTTRLRGFDPQQPPSDLPQNAWLINATSAGLRPDDSLPIDLAAIPRPSGVYDMIYNPPATPLLAKARALGLPTANGLSMLIHQGARALEIWSGAAVPVAAMEAAVRVGGI